MRIQVNAVDTDNDNAQLIISVFNNYFKLSDAREVYRKSKEEGVNDDNVVLEIRTVDGGGSQIKNTLVLGVEEAEDMAFTLLSVSKEIKD